MSIKKQKSENMEFGMVVTLVLLVISLWWEIDLYVFAVITLLVGLLTPVLYTPFTWFWFRIAKILEQVMSKVLLFLVFYLVITPVGWIRRLTGKDSLQLNRFAKNKDSVFSVRNHTYTKVDLEKQF